MESKLVNISFSEPFIYTPAFLVSPGFYLGPHLVRIKVEKAVLFWFLSWQISLIFQSFTTGEI